MADFSNIVCFFICTTIFWFVLKMNSNLTRKKYLHRSFFPTMYTIRISTTIKNCHWLISTTSLQLHEICTITTTTRTTFCNIQIIMILSKYKSIYNNTKISFFKFSKFCRLLFEHSPKHQDHQALRPNLSVWDNIDFLSVIPSNH